MCSFGGLEQHGEPINPGWLCPSQGKTSSSAVAQRATTRELGWAGLCRPFPGSGSPWIALHPLESAGMQIQGHGCTESRVDSAALWLWHADVDVEFFTARVVSPGDSFCS